MIGKRDPPYDAVLLINVGSPASPSAADVRRYLNEFLMDPQVLDLPYLIRKILVCCIILPRRAARVSAAYQAIWRPDGSPLLSMSDRVCRLLQDRIPIPVGLGMRYGLPSIAGAIRAILDRSARPVTRLLVVPLYPHYAMATYGSAVAEARRVAARIDPSLSLAFFPPCYDEPLYIEALVACVRPYLSGGFDHLLFSYHGLPLRHLRKTDPTRSHCLLVKDCCLTPSPAHATCYRAQVLKTTAAFILRAGIPEGRHSVAFQSRAGRAKWLEPSTAAEIRRLGSLGVKRLLVACPSFVSDCLETIEEIGMRGRSIFLEAGGAEFELIPCLNDHPQWIDALSAWCRGESGGGAFPRGE